MDTGSKKNGTDRAKVRGERKKSHHAGSSVRNFIHRVTNPDRWTLRDRFLYLTGILLVFGSVFQVYCLSSSLEQAIREQAESHLQSRTLSMRRRLNDQRILVKGQAATLADFGRAGSLLAEGDERELKILAEETSDLLNLTMDMGPWMVRVHAFSQPDSSDPAAASSEQPETSGESDAAPDPMLEAARQKKDIVAGLYLQDHALLMRAVAPAGDRIHPLGAVDLSIPVQDIMGRSFDQNFSQTLLRRCTHDTWSACDENKAWEENLTRTLLASDDPVRSGDVFYSLQRLSDFQGREVGALVLGYDASLLEESRTNKVYQLGGFFITGAVLFWAILFFNIRRIENFLHRLKKIIIASHSSDFSERFETDHIHCLEVMNCHNEECPVYKDPSRVCYLETGSEAISPVWRDTCIFLNRYDTCHACPVYALRKGDELSEMRNVVNTMVRLWGNFLSHTGHLLAYVLRSHEAGTMIPSLDQVSMRLEQMAKLTFFSHDVQGTMDKSEVYAQLAHVFKDEFNLSNFVLFEVDHESDRIVIALDESKEPLCKREVLLSTEVCRANRVAEEVHSYYNPVLCPHFNCDHGEYVRCCLPMVMGGKVGAVFTFMIRRTQWERARNEIVPVVRKYLDEAAPVLSSLNLLQLSKEMSLRDPLTHAHNRRFLDEFITKYEPLCQRDGRRTGLLMADLDYFKQVNDEHGHEAGDRVLKDVVAIIKDSIRKSDLLVRYGGEEFLVLLQDIEPDASFEVAEKIRSKVESCAFQIDDQVSIHKTISLGVAEYPEDGNTMYKAIKFADVALYEAKNRGRNQVVRFTPEMWQSDQY